MQSLLCPETERIIHVKVPQELHNTYIIIIIKSYKTIT